MVTGDNTIKKLILCGFLALSSGLALRGATAASETYANPASAPVADAPTTITTPATKPLVRVALYDHSGNTAKEPGILKRILTPREGFDCQRVTPQDIQNGCLKNFDILVLPGGSGSLQAKKLTARGRDNIRQFVSRGGGYIGICAGSYLASSTYKWSLSLINARVVDSQHWARGTGQVKINMTPLGKALLDEQSDVVDVYYGQGPLLAPDTKPGLPAYEPLALYSSEIAKKGVPTGVMVGTTAIARTIYGQGHVICVSPHPEAKDGPNHLILDAARWVTPTAKP